MGLQKISEKIKKRIGIDISEPSIEGSSLNGIAKLEVGLDVDDSGSDTFDSRLAYVGLDNNGVAITVGRQGHSLANWNQRTHPCAS